MRKLLALAIAGVLVLSGVALASHNFPDVPDDHTHHDNIGWAADNGVVRGFADGLFRPNANITRGQAATMFAQYNDHILGVEELTWYATQVDSTYITATGEVFEDDENEDFAPSPGDRFTFSDDVFVDEARTDQVGTNTGACTFVTAGGETEEDFFASVACHGDVRVDGEGDVSWQIRGDFPQEFEGVTGSITGGTGAYFGASGEVEIVFDPEEDDPPADVYHVRLRVPSSD
jgi:hypothetical protein